MNNDLLNERWANATMQSIKVFKEKNTFNYRYKTLANSNSYSFVIAVRLQLYARVQLVEW